MTLLYLFAAVASALVAFGVFSIIIERKETPGTLLALGLTILATFGFVLLAFQSHENNWNETCRNTGGVVMPSGVCDYPGDDD